MIICDLCKSVTAYATREEAPFEDAKIDLCATHKGRYIEAVKQVTAIFRCGDKLSETQRQTSLNYINTLSSNAKEVK